MLQAWLSFGYLVLIAVGLLAFVLWRQGSPLLAVAALVVGVPLWFGWEYARPTWTSGLITGTEVRRSDPDKRGNTSDIEYIYMRNRSDRGMELINDDSWWWLKRNSERVFNDAKTAQDRNTEMTLLWNRWRSTLLSKYPNVIAIGERRPLAVVVAARDRLLRALDRAVARVFLRLHPAAEGDCGGGMSTSRRAERGAYAHS